MPAEAGATVLAMTGFQEPHPDLIVPNPGGSDDPLGESVLDPAQPALRVFTPREVGVVIGRHQDPLREVDIAACQADGLPIHRRVSGGGTVVLAPGMVVVALRLPNDRLGTSIWFDLINPHLVAAVRAAGGPELVTHRLGDLAVAGADGRIRKVLGASLRQTSRIVVYLGVFLVDDAVPLMERYLRHPSREPDYRGGRNHRDFCVGLGRYGITPERLITAIDHHLKTLGESPAAANQ